MPNPIKAAEFLQKARDRFKYCLEAWRDIREEHDLDVRFLAGNQWDATELRISKDKRRPAIVLDALTQFVNQLINDVRMNKRAVKVMPMGAGANDKTASANLGMQPARRPNRQPWRRQALVFSCLTPFL